MTLSSDGLEEVDWLTTRNVLGGDEGCGRFDSRHCAAWEGSVTLVLVGCCCVVLAGLLCIAILRRLRRFAFAPVGPKPDIDIAVDSDPCVQP